MQKDIDPIVVDAVEGKPLPKGHRASAFAAELPPWHPVKLLFNGEAQWLGQCKAVYDFLRLFCLVYDDFIWRPSATDPAVDAHAEFLRIFPNDVVFMGQRFRMHGMYAEARNAIEAVTDCFPPMRTIGLDAFDRTFSALVRSIKST
jgi:hypothetical protein